MKQLVEDLNTERLYGDSGDHDVANAIERVRKLWERQFHLDEFMGAMYDLRTILKASATASPVPAMVEAMGWLDKLDHDVEAQLQAIDNEG